ncbi:YpdA family putative bacillithiol disulfide reductase, partial [bacterium]|nr:YpdA family putative bacillithiol disulfide reductase [bacterium]
AGPIGLACALSARKRGLDPLLVDAGPVVASITRYPVGMTFFTTPELLEIGAHPFPCAHEKPTREEAMRYYRGIVRTEGLRVRTYTRLVAARPEGDVLLCDLEGEAGPETLATDRLVLATGYFGHARRLDVPGEELPHVSHVYDEGHLSYDRDVVVVGGKNSAVEAALDLFRCGARVTLVHRGEAAGATVKYWVRPDFENRVKAREIAARFSTRVTRITPDAVHVIDAAGNDDALPARRVYLLTGYRPDFDLFRRCGVRLHPETMRPELDEDTLESNVPGIHLVGSITRGRAVSEVFIENGRFDGEKVFAAASRPRR